MVSPLRFELSRLPTTSYNSSVVIFEDQDPSRGSLPLWRWALAGALALVPAMAVSYALRRTAGGILLPEIVAQYVIEQVPGMVARWAIGTLGKAAKVIGFIIAFGGFFLVAASFAKYFQRLRDILPGERNVAKGLGFAAITMLMTLVLLGFVGVTSPGLFGPYRLVPSLVSAILFNVIFGITLAAVSRSETIFGNAPPQINSATGERNSPGRRLFLVSAATVAASVALVAAISRDLLDYIGTGIGTLPGRLPSFFTPNNEFYVVQKEVGAPFVDPAAWNLKIEGLVARPFTIDYEELQKLARAERIVTLECIDNNVGGSLISNARWRGVPLRELLARAGVREGARKVVVHATGGYADSLTIAQASDPDVVVAVEMNGARLPRAHGYPARLVTPGLYGIKNVKWIERIEVVGDDFKGFWQQRGWTDEGTIKTMAKFSIPVNKAVVSASGVVQLGGVAFAGNRGISKVEVSVDGGREWREAEVHKDPAPTLQSWVVWTLAWTPASEGEYEMMVRAWDGRGVLQTIKEKGVFPDGSSGYHNIKITARNAA